MDPESRKTRRFETGELHELVRSENQKLRLLDIPDLREPGTAEVSLPPRRPSLFRSAALGFLAGVLVVAAYRLLT